MSRTTSKLNILVLTLLVILLTIFPHGYIKGESRKKDVSKSILSMPVFSKPATERYVVRMQKHENACLRTFNINVVKQGTYLQDTISVQDSNEYLPQNAASLNQISMECANLAVGVSNHSKVTLKVQNLVERYALRNTNTVVVQYRERATNLPAPMLHESRTSFVAGYKENTTEIRYTRTQKWTPKMYIGGKSSQYEILLC